MIRRWHLCMVILGSHVCMMCANTEDAHRDLKWTHNNIFISHGSYIVTHNNHQISTSMHHHNTLLINIIVLYFHPTYYPPIVHSRISRLLPTREHSWHQRTQGVPIASSNILLTYMPYTTHPSFAHDTQSIDIPSTPIRLESFCQLFACNYM